MKTVKMIFGEDQSYNFEPKYFLKGVEYDVPEKDVERWLKRTGRIVEPAKVEFIEPEIIEDDLPDFEEQSEDESCDDDEGYF